MILGAAAPPSVHPIDLGTSGGRAAYDSSAVGIDAAGDVVVNSSDIADLDQRAFVWRDGRRIVLPTLGPTGRYTQSWAAAVNARGDVVGDASAARGETHAALWRDGSPQDLGVLPGGDLSEADVVADNGDVAGRSKTATGQHAFLWRHGRLIDLGPPPPVRGSNDPNVLVNAINESDEIVGSTETEFFGHETRERAFRSLNGRLVPLLPPSRDSDAVDVNEAGDVAGSYALSSGVTHACIWRKGRLVDLGTLPHLVDSRAVALDDRGDVIGTASNKDDSIERAFIWRDGSLTPLGTLGGSNSGALGINENGQVVGMSTTRTGRTHGFLWQNGAMTDLGALAGGDSRAEKIDAKGRIVGMSSVAQGHDHAVLWPPR